MKKINKFLTCLLFTAISIASFTVFNVSASEKSWQEAYLEAMDEFSQNQTEYCECRLLYLNEDEIPELYIGDPMVFWYGGLYSYSNGDLIKLKDFGFKDFFSAYSERNGIFRNDYFIEKAGSKIGINFIKMEDFSLTVIDELSHDIVNDIYEVNGEPVDKETYDNKISEYSFTHVNKRDLFDSSEYKYSFTDITSNYMTYDEMKQYLIDSMEVANTDDTTPTESVSKSENLTTTSANIDNTTISNTTLSTETTVKTSATTTNTKSGSPKTGDNGITAAFLTGIAAIGTALIMRNKKTL